MKKAILFTICTAFVVAALGGCGGSASENKGESIKTGLAIISSIGNSKDAGEKDGLAQIDSDVVAVTVGKDGKILDCQIDSVQTQINFDKEGKIITSLDAEVKSKQELGTGYGMIKASGIKKEWNEQADALAKYVIGKTVNEVKGIAVNEKGEPKGSDLTASVTFTIAGYIKAIEKAVDNAEDMGAKAGDKLGLGIITNVKDSVNASPGKEGLAQAYSTYTALTVGSDGKITSAIIDASQGNVNFSEEGKVTSDINTAPKTKNELGPEYGMAKASTIKKEWNEQAKSFAEYVKGKDLSGVKGISVSEAGVPADRELTASVTMHVTDLIGVVEKAYTNAR